MCVLVLSDTQGIWKVFMTTFLCIAQSGLPTRKFVLMFSIMLSGFSTTYVFKHLPESWRGLNINLNPGFK